MPEVQYRQYWFPYTHNLEHATNILNIVSFSWSWEGSVNQAFKDQFFQNDPLFSGRFFLDKIKTCHNPRPSKIRQEREAEN